MQQTEQLLQALTNGDEVALNALLDGHRDYLRRLLEWQMGAELRSRIDPSDVIQETHIVVSRRIEEFLDTRPTSFKVWLRGKALERLIEARRKHVVADMRSVRREVALSDASSMALAHAVASPSPSAAVSRAELVQRINQSVGELSEMDREVLLLRHVEQLDNAEAAEVLGVEPKTASKRYGRALLRLRAKLRQTGISLNE
jgi:RNA polymerase sigma-70 factor, ECF subfamily